MKFEYGKMNRDKISFNRNTKIVEGVIDLGIFDFLKYRNGRLT